VKGSLSSYSAFKGKERVNRSLRSYSAFKGKERAKGLLVYEIHCKSWCTFFTYTVTLPAQTFTHSTASIT
jgi:hypothetical protein